MGESNSLNNFAISSQGLGEAMQRSAAALATAGNTLDESLGLVTGANEIVQNPEVVGTWAKTLTMYLRAASVEAEEAGIETEGMASSVSDLRDQILALTSNRVDIMQDDSTFKSTVQIMRELAAVYDSLADVDQAALLNLVSGKRQANTTSALLTNWEQVEAAIVSSQNSLGSADEENAKYLDSIEGKIQQFQASFQSLSTTLLSNELVKFFVDLGSGALTAAEGLVKVAGVLPTIAALASTLLTASGTKAGKATQFLMPLNMEKTGLGNKLWDKITGASAGRSVANELGLEEADALFNAFNTSVTAGGVELQKFMTTCSRPEFAKFLNGNQENNRTFESSSSALKTYNASVASAAASQQKLSLATAATTAKTVALNAAITMGIGFLVQFAVGKVSKLITAHKDAIEKSKTLISDYNTTLDDLKEKENTISDIGPDYERLSSGVDAYGQNVSLTADEYSRYNEIVSKVASMFPSMVSGYNAEGNAILRYKGNVDALTGALIEQQKVAALQHLAQSTDIAKGIKNETSDIEKEIHNMDSAIAKLRHGGSNQSGNKGLLSGYGLAFSDFSNTTEEERAAAINSLLQTRATYLNQVKQKQSQINDLLRIYVQYSSDAYKHTSDEVLQNAYMQFTSGLDPSKEQFNYDPSKISAFIDNVINQVNKASPEIQGAFADMMNFDPSTMSLNEITSTMNDMMRKLHHIPSLQSITSNDWMKMLGFDSLKFDIRTAANTVINNVGSAIDAAVKDGRFKIDLSELLGMESPAKLSDVTKNVKDALSQIMPELTLDQIGTFNRMIMETGDSALGFTSRLLNLAESGVDVGSVLNDISAIVNSNGKEFRTVSGDIAEYQTAIESLGASSFDNHDYLRSVYKELKESADLGAINDEKSRKQMELLYGQTLSLAELRERIASTKSFFFEDDDGNVAKETYKMWENFTSLYSKLPDEQKKLAEVDFDTHSIKVAQNDVEELANALHMGPAMLQDFFDVITSFEDYSKPTFSTIDDNIQAVNDGLARLNTDNVSGLSNAWEELSKRGLTDAKIALEDLFGAEYDFSNMSVDTLREVVDGFNSLRGGLPGGFNADSLITVLQAADQKLDDTILKVQTLSDGSISIDVSDLDLLAKYLDDEYGIKISAPSLGTVLQQIDGVTTKAGDGITINVDTNEEDVVSLEQRIDNLFTALETPRGINITNEEAIKQVNAVASKILGLSSLRPQINVSYTGTLLPPIPGYSETNFGGTPQKDAYTGIIGGNFATGMPRGGVSGKILVGELGPELWISKDGLRQQLVGQNGMEVIHVDKGDAIVPAGLTSGLIKGGLKGNAALYGAANSSGTWWNNMTSGSTWKKSSVKSSPASLSDKTSSKDSDDAIKKQAEAEIATLKYKLHMELITEQQYYDELSKINEKYYKGKEAYIEEERSLNMELFDLKRELAEDDLTDMEHQLFLNEKHNGSIDSQISMYRDMMDYIAELGKEARAQGLDDNSEYIQKLSKQWWDHRDSVTKLQKQQFDDVLDLFDQYVDDKNDLNTWGTDSEVAALERQLKYIENQYSANLISYEDYAEAKRDVSKSIYEIEQDSLNEILDLTKKMIKQENEDAIDALQKQIDQYQEIIEAKKKSLELSEAQRTYDMERDEKTTDIADLQKQADALALDDTREGQIKRAAILEKIADKQKELNEFQHDHSIEMQQDALDTELDNYEKEKNDEIDRLREKLDTEGKLYAAAIDYINNNYDSLKDKLLAYNKEFGSGIDTDVLTPWNNVLSVIEQVKTAYGELDFEKAFDVSQDTASDRVESSSGVQSLVQRMKSNSERAKEYYQDSKDWNDPRIENLNGKNEDLAKKIEALTGADVGYDSHSGKWLINGEDLYSNYHKYHTGGVVASKPTLQQDEVMAILQRGEVVFNREDQSVLYKLLTGVQTMQSIAAIAKGAKFDVLGELGVNQATNANVPASQRTVGDISIDASVAISGETSQDVLLELEKHPRKVSNIVSKTLIDSGIVSPDLKSKLS